MSLIGENISKKMTFSSLRSSPTIAVLAEQCSRYVLDKEKYPFLNWDKSEMPKIDKKYGTKNIFGGNDNNLTDISELEPLIVFNIGGLSHNEISALEKLQKNNNLNHRIYIGSTCIFNANEYIDQLKNIDKECIKEIGNDCLDDEMIENYDKMIIDNDIPNRMSLLSEKDKLE